MAEDTKYKCPRCQTQTDIGVRRCPDPMCRAELGFCSHCRQLSTFQDGRCGRCDGEVKPCLMRSIGANCNGFARIEGVGAVICDRCRERAGAVVRWGVGAYAVSALLSAIRPKK